MITDKLLVEELNFIGVDGLDDDIIIKCLDIANRHQIDAERFVEEWIAFAQTNLNGILKPTAVTLDTMERKQLCKKQEKITVNKKTNEPSTAKIKVYSNKSNAEDLDDILDAYNDAVTPKKTQSKDDTNATFSPATYNPEIYIMANPPNVLILIGPFVDIRHTSALDGTMADAYDEHFENLLKKVINPLQDTNIQIVIIPSVLDAHHFNVFPTPPFQSLPKLQNPYNVHMVSDPAMLDINGVLIGACSIDVLFHMAKSEYISQPENTDRMARFSEYILNQRCFYPLYPAQTGALEDRRLPVDLKFLSIHGQIDVKPHILIIPSNLKKFIKNINGCVVINPERLSKGYVGGTFACVNIYPNTSSNQQSLASNITCKIIKI